MTPGPVDQDALERHAVAVLRQAGARFAFVHGSRAGTGAPDALAPRPDSDLDVAAWWGGDPPPAWKVPFDRERIDLLVLDRAPLELAGRVAVWGRLIFDDDPPARVTWQAQTRSVYFDEEPRQRFVDRLFFEAHRSGR